MSADEVEAWRSERRAIELEIREDRQQQRICAYEDAAAQADVVGMSQAQWVLDEGWPIGADAPDEDARARRTGRSR